ncbi:MAG: DUF1592 domain-containing protein [Alphaproteobacteria bacterium]|nr:DUF1592 domain-containing protein [Alphaproteobacteria bacterium]
MRPVIVVAVLLGACAETGPGDATPKGGSSDTDVERPADTDLPEPGPGRVALRRLTRSELDRTVRDLLGVDLGVRSRFPDDDATAGFETVASGLTISPLHVELWTALAADAADAILTPPFDAPVARRVEVEDGAFSVGEDVGQVHSEGMRLWDVGTIDGSLQVPVEGRWRVTLRAIGNQGGDEVVRVRLSVGSADPVELQVQGVFPTWDAHTVELRLPRGRVPVSVAFLNPFHDGKEERTVDVDAFELEGPLDPTPSPAWTRWMRCDPQAPPDGQDAVGCIADVLTPLVPAAWRRPVDAAELEALASLAAGVIDGGGTPTQALAFALRAVFASPAFVLHVEPPPPAEGTAPLPPHVLANRLAYVLWSSAPDAALRARAEAGTLDDPAVLADEIRRMLADPRAAALADDLAGPWLRIRAVDRITPDPITFPAFDEAMRASMKAAMVRMFDDLLASDEPVTTLLEGTDAWVDEVLAPLYDLPVDGFGPALEPVDMAAQGRRGWLTQPGLLAATSYPRRTSPVKRGVWVLTELLCDAPDPPPPNVGALPDDDGAPSTVRARLEAHRALPQCAACHEDIDPIGLALEAFDGLGRHRTHDGSLPVDTRGELPDGTLVDGSGELAAVLAQDDRFARCVVEKVFTFAHRRAPTDEDGPWIDKALAAARADGLSLRAVLTAVLTGETFRRHGGAR